MENFIYKEEGYQIIGCFFSVYNTLGPGFLESVYQEALEKEFVKNNIPYQREQKLEIIYNDEKLKKFFKADFICFDAIIVEIKAQKMVSEVDFNQIVNYLNASKIKVGYLVNFGSSKLFFKRFINTN